MSTNSRQALVGHIGGTFISLAIADIDELSVANFALLSSADFTTPVDAIERYLKSVPGRPDMVGLAIAGEVEGDTARMTYHPWTIDRAEIARITGASHIVFVPDLEAIAQALPHLTDYDLIEVHTGKAAKAAPKALVSVGTGLSVAALVPARQGWVAVPGLGASMSLPLAASDETTLRGALASDGMPAAGDVLSGDGLVALYGALAQGTGATAADPPHIIKAGIAGDDPVAAAALERFAAWLGRFAGDVALLYGATGGVYLGGVIAPNMAPVLASEAFRKAFEGAGERQSHLSSVRVSVIKTAADAGLRGAAIAMAQSLASAEGGPRHPLSTAR